MFFNDCFYVEKAITYWIIGNTGNQKAITKMYSGTQIIFNTRLSGSVKVMEGTTSNPKLSWVKDGLDTDSITDFLSRLNVVDLPMKTAFECLK